MLLDSNNVLLQGSVERDALRAENQFVKILAVAGVDLDARADVFCDKGIVKYRDAAADIYHYICNVMVDKRPGSEWFWEVDADGKPSSRKPILEPWKCPYHNGRMCMELIRRNPDVTV